LIEERRGVSEGILTHSDAGIFLTLRARLVPRPSMLRTVMKNIEMFVAGTLLMITVDLA